MTERSLMKRFLLDSPVQLHHVIPCDRRHRQNSLMRGTQVERGGGEVEQDGTGGGKVGGGLEEEEMKV